MEVTFQISRADMFYHQEKCVNDIDKMRFWFECSNYICNAWHRGTLFYTTTTTSMTVIGFEMKGRVIEIKTRSQHITYFCFVNSEQIFNHPGNILQRVHSLHFLLPLVMNLSAVEKTFFKEKKSEPRPTSP